jgi:carboxypeptidase C (cathepsin A)
MTRHEQLLRMKTLPSLLALLAAMPLAAAEPDSTNSAATNPPPAKASLATIPDASFRPVTTTNAVTIGGERVTYVAETGMLPVLKTDGTSRASVFYVAYTRQDATNATARPVMFCFNGGPGSASVWLHMGALGPRRAKMNPDGSQPAPPFGLVDNEYSPLAVSDLVFIDPIATGFSRTAKDAKPDDFFGEMADVESIGEFVRLWTTRHQRWLSPKYLCGESYGVYRAAGLAEHLRQSNGMYLNGLILVSGVLDFATLEGDTGNDLRYPLDLPAYTAAAHFHHKLPADLQANLDQALAECRAFARGEYLSALHAGADLPAAEQAKVVAELARLTGLPPRVIIDNQLRVDPAVFRKQLLHDDGLILGAYDARLTGRDGNPHAEGPEFDPSSAAVTGAFSAAMNAYVRGELKFEDDLPYELLVGVQPWNYAARNSYPNASDRLASVMNQNPYLRVLVCGGRCDLVCPIDTIRHSLDHMPLADAYHKNITFAEFDSGHMMYINQPDLQKLQAEVEKFVRP